MGQQGRSAMRWCERGREGADVTEQKSIALELSIMQTLPPREVCDKCRKYGYGKQHDQAFFAAPASVCVGGKEGQGGRQHSLWMMLASPAGLCERGRKARPQ
eukprot:scaffold260852_cov13-Tisochrysis_lutea.AAC.1